MAPGLFDEQCANQVASLPIPVAVVRLHIGDLHSVGWDIGDSIKIH